MTSKPITGYRLDKKTGKLVKNPARMAAGQRQNIEAKAARLEKLWRGKDVKIKPKVQAEIDRVGRETDAYLEKRREAKVWARKSK